MQRPIRSIIGFVVGAGVVLAVEFLLVAAFSSGDSHLIPRGLGWVGLPILAGIAGAGWASRSRSEILTDKSYSGQAAYEVGDFAKALRLCKPAAEQGNARAEYTLGLMYYFGRGVPQNYLEAAKWYRRAAEQGDPNAQYNLGLMYHHGQGVPRDDAESMKWLSAYNHPTLFPNPNQPPRRGR